MEKAFQIRSWDWEVTRRCNLECLHCIVSKKYQCKEMDTVEALAVVAAIASMGGETLRLTGGEPLLRQDLGKIIKKATELGLRVELITNGLLIDEAFLCKFGKYLRHIAVSIDGQESVHDYVRGEGTYSKAVNALRLIMSHSIDTSVYITIHSANEESIGELVPDLLLLGIRKLHLNEINREGAARDNAHLLLNKLQPQEKVLKIMSQLQSSIKLDEKKISVDTSCTISPEIAYLGCDGAIYACAEFAVSAPGQSIGHISESDLKRKYEQFFSAARARMPMECRYHSFILPGVGICLNRHDACPLIKEVKDEPRFT